LSDRNSFGHRGKIRRILHKQNEQKTKQSVVVILNEKTKFSQVVDSWYWLHSLTWKILLLWWIEHSSWVWILTWRNQWHLGWLGLGRPRNYFDKFVIAPYSAHATYYEIIKQMDEWVVGGVEKTWGNQKEYWPFGNFFRKFIWHDRRTTGRNSSRNYWKGRIRKWNSKLSIQVLGTVHSINLANWLNQKKRLGHQRF